MKYPKLSALLLASLFLLQACKDDEPAKVYDVPSIIQPYIDLFEQEAAARGQTLNIDNLKVEFETDLQGGDAAGLCTFASPNTPTPHIRLDTTSYNWQNNEYHREILIFHELGHCILNRLHKDDVLANGNFASIMRSTGEQLYGGSLNAFKRDYYLDELFNSSTPAPDWASAGPAYGSVTAAQKTAVFTENFLNNFAGWNIGSSANTTTQITNGYLFFESKNETNAYFTSKQINLDDEKDFEIETAIRFASGENSAMIEWGGASGNDLFFYGFTPDSTAFTGNWTTGVAASRPSDLLRPNEYNKLTIRRIGEYYYLYINESLFEVLKFEPFYGNLFAFYVGPKTAIQVDYLRVSVLN